VDPARGEPNRADDVTILNRLLELGDFFLCASERQRDFWLGALAVKGRLELAHAQADPELRRLLDVVAFGLPEEPPRRTGPGPRAALPGVGQDAKLLLWNGGLWNWLDPLTAIRAVARVARDEPRVRLVFMGTRSPGAQVAEMEMVATARALAAELDLLDRHIFFNDWVAYEERQNWLLDADIALSLHVATVEARYAFRTRLLDNLWCGVPTIATAGDVLADIVRDEQVGLVVPPGDAEAVADAVRRLLEPDVARASRANLATIARRHTWERVCAPLLAYCRAPWRLGSARGADAAADYTHNLERLYSETAQYARQLERAVADKDAALHDLSRPPKRLDLGALLRRGRRG
jgi:glycosyltransferase involved in cell wall biosynthesis